MNSILLGIIFKHIVSENRNEQRFILQSAFSLFYEIEFEKKTKSVKVLCLDS